MLSQDFGYKDIDINKFIVLTERAGDSFPARVKIDLRAMLERLNDRLLLCSARST